MWFRPLLAVSLGLLIAAISVQAQDRPTAAVAFVDVKFDDKVAIWSLLLDSRYSKVVAITSGIENHGKAASELEQYLERQNAMSNVRKVNLGKIQIFRGTNPFGAEVPHEYWWNDNGEATKPEASEAALGNALRGHKVRVFQLAPSTAEQIRGLFESAEPNSIESYMLLHGYNSRQSNAERGTYLLQNLRAWLKERNPEAELFFTTSHDSYANKQGGKQYIEQIKPMFPKKDLNQAIKDPFWSMQIQKAYEERLTQRPFTIKNRVPDLEELDNLIYHARVNPMTVRGREGRKSIASFINKVLKQHPETETESLVLKRFRYTFLPEFAGEPTLELADANHVAAFHRNLDDWHNRGVSDMYWDRVKYPDGPHDIKTIPPFKEATSNSDAHGWLLRGADRDEDLLHIKRLAGLFR
ncbi:uncharacterized protein MEPE_01889 [Melanopsichium pennsylvanicum]|uniref:Uncharacterized protein n=2 Tax=Melanopsichium pennsylvanicum TaxID=63383 RepID=A0AAJ4XLA8_9BASI|nr:uncharacterized protein BN887_04181 [Melanopsichium pennsylvanicum 4]SNX83183.1 uncharacterized protein MEPE_01889 [Melanopsichium pennsylvanicum]